VEPPKYVLLSHDAEAEFSGEEGYEETWAMCADAENLFGDPSPPARGTYHLLGCAAEGELSTALTRARAEGSALLGTPHTGSCPLTFEELLAFFAEKRVDLRLT